MFRISLSGKEQAVVAQKYKTATDRRVRERCQAVLMAHRGRKRQVIAEDLGVHRTTVKKCVCFSCKNSDNIARSGTFKVLSISLDGGTRGIVSGVCSSRQWFCRY
jgi:hypothetical protein